MKTAAITIALIAVIAPMYGDEISCFENCKPSSQGLFVTRSLEGFCHRGNGCPDGAKKEIGYGHDIKSGESFPLIVTPSLGEKILENDMRAPQEFLNKEIRIPLKISQADALLDLFYNSGTGDKKELVKRVNGGKNPEFLNFDHITVNGKKVEDRGLKYRCKVREQWFGL